MPISWNLFRVVCFIQLLTTVYLCFSSLIKLFKQGDLFFFLEANFFLLMAVLAVFSINLLTTNYPDRPVSGSQKSWFNWLFLLNFLLLAFLFGLFFYEYRRVNRIDKYLGAYNNLPFEVWIPLIRSVVVIVFHCLILYGLFKLRVQLYKNFHTSKVFDFEKERNS